MYFLPTSGLWHFWSAILLHTQCIAGFCQPWLVVMAHNLKLCTRCLMAQQCWSDYLNHLKWCFITDPWIMSQNHTWLNFSIKDVLKGTEMGIIFLCKSICVWHWSNQFCCSQFTQCKIQTDLYFSIKLHNVFSASVELQLSNQLCQYKEITYNKSYFSFKNVWTTLIKGYVSFNNSSSEALNFSETLLDRWYAFNKYEIITNLHSRSRFQDYRCDVCAFYKQIKFQIAISLICTDNFNYDFEM